MFVLLSSTPRYFILQGRRECVVKYSVIYQGHDNNACLLINPRQLRSEGRRRARRSEFPAELGTQSNRLTGRRTLSQITRELSGRMCRNWLCPRVQLKKKIPLCWESARFLGWNFLSELSSPSMAERTTRGEGEAASLALAGTAPVCRQKSLQARPVRA